MIYPNRIINEIGQLNVTSLANLRNNYEPLGTGTNPSVLKYSGFNGSLCNDLWPVAPNYTISNYGETVINSCDIKVLQNGAVIYEENWTGDAQPYDIISEIAVPTVIATENIVFDLLVDNINGTDEGTLNYLTSVTLEVNNEITVRIETDENSETDANYLAITNSDGDVVETMDLSTPNTLHEQTFYLPSTGCYRITIFDEGEDGIDGEVSVTDGEGWYILRESETAEEFGYRFNVGSMASSSVDILEDLALNLFPNPTNDKLNIQINTTSQDDLQLNILNHLGQLIKTKHLTEQDLNSRITFDVSTFDSGLYFLNVKNESGVMSKKFMIN